MTSIIATSTGGKEFWVAQSGEDVHLNWNDLPMDAEGDALLSPEDALQLGEALVKQALEIMNTTQAGALQQGTPPWRYITVSEELTSCPECGGLWASIHGVFGCRSCMLAEG